MRVASSAGAFSGYVARMRGKLGLAVGFAAGYYFGAKAGRERYIQMQRWASRARESDFVETAADKARAVVDLGVERARDLVERGGDEDDTVDTSFSPAGRAGNGDYSP